MRYFMKDVMVDNRDSDTTWLHFPNGTVFEIMREDLDFLRLNMDENAAVEKE